MKKTAVIYKSKYGATKTYATWIAEELHADLYEKIDVNKLKDYQTIIYGGALYAGTINGISSLIKNFPSLKDKKIIVFTCSLADPTNPENIKYIHNNLDKIMSNEIKKHITFFHFRGEMDYKKLSFIHRSMMSMLIRMLKKKDPSTLSVDDKGMLESYGKAVSFIDNNAITPLIKFVQNI